jgi:hypothetical protein
MIQGYDCDMSKPKEYEQFENALNRVLRVSHGEMKERIEADKRAHADRPKRGPKPKTSASDHASDSKD